MRMKALRWLGLVVIIVTVILTTYSLSADEQLNDDVEQILKLHRELIESHISRDVDGVLAAESEELLVVSGGEVHFRTKAERFAQFERYFRSVEFAEYRDLIDPIVRVSDDRTLGWLTAQVRIAGTQTDSAGEQNPFDMIWAWIELYEKHDGRWVRIGEVSNVKSSNP
ncbi:MAG: hypothetical protein JSV86_05310 [Gemmatimonadota bacterium]|nr:MAG: hypothetical protein JSV86_05310 [Gemmatimonadota bacterium]